MTVSSWMAALPAPWPERRRGWPCRPDQGEGEGGGAGGWPVGAMAEAAPGDTAQGESRAVLANKVVDGFEIGHLFQSIALGLKHLPVKV